ncbi:MAG: hypothetical protein P4L82_16855 [Ancalomicrobiaceae bacterium]|nr:hypothetical protein [Ancalomicrobiaceae bacterium]
MRRFVLTITIVAAAMLVGPPASAHFSQVFGQLKVDLALTAGPLMLDRSACEGHIVDRLAPEWTGIDV